MKRTLYFAHKGARASLCADEAEYRAYVLDDCERIWFPAQIVEADCDEAAVDRAAALADGCVVELWRGQRLIGRIHPVVPPSVVRADFSKSAPGRRRAWLRA